GSPVGEEVPEWSYLVSMAEDKRFELLRACTQHAFQACALGHYANPPPSSLPESSGATGRSPACGGPSQRPRAAPRCRLTQHQVPRLTTLAPDPPHGAIPPTPPGPEGSKGTRARTRVRGGPYAPVRSREGQQPRGH